MRYMGGKQRIAKQIASLLQPLLGSGYYVEPFVEEPPWRHRLTIRIA